MKITDEQEQELWKLSHELFAETRSLSEFLKGAYMLGRQHQKALHVEADNANAELRAALARDLADRDNKLEGMIPATVVQELVRQAVDQALEDERIAIAYWLVADNGAKCYPGSGVETLFQAAAAIRARGKK